MGPNPPHFQRHLPAVGCFDGLFTAEGLLKYQFQYSVLYSLSPSLRHSMWLPSLFFFPISLICVLFQFTFFLRIVTFGRAYSWPAVVPLPVVVFFFLLIFKLQRAMRKLGAPHSEAPAHVGPGAPASRLLSSFPLYLAAAMSI